MHKTAILVLPVKRFLKKISPVGEISQRSIAREIKRKSRMSVSKAKPNAGMGTVLLLAKMVVESFDAGVIIAEIIPVIKESPKQIIARVGRNAPCAKWLIFSS